MAGRAAYSHIGDLPPVIPIFPLSGVLLLPRARLPLNIFEPRYLAMTDAAMAGGRMIGMLQPIDEAEGENEPAIRPVGCAGRITEFRETDDGRYLITLIGIARFRVTREMARTTPYRQAAVDYGTYASDLAADRGEIDRARLKRVLQPFLATAGIPADLAAIEKAPDEAVVNALAIICPFSPVEKQALLEAADLAARGELLVSLMEMALLGRQGQGGGRPQ